MSDGRALSGHMASRPTCRPILFRSLGSVVCASGGGVGGWRVGGRRHALPSDMPAYPLSFSGFCRVRQGWWIGKSRQPQSHGKHIFSWRGVGKSSDPPPAKPPHFPTHRHHSRWWVGQFPDPPPSKYIFSMTL